MGKPRKYFFQDRVVEGDVLYFEYNERSDDVVFGAAREGRIFHCGSLEGDYMGRGSVEALCGFLEEIAISGISLSKWKSEYGLLENGAVIND